MKNQALYLILLFCVLQPILSQVLESVFEDFNNKKISFSNRNWVCELENKVPKSLECPKGMDLVLLERVIGCQVVQVRIDQLLPHFAIQFYIDIYAYQTIDNNECLIVDIQGVQKKEQCIYWSTVQSNGLNQYCDRYPGKSIRNTQIIELDHSDTQVNIKISSTADQELLDEAYLFRNVQLFLHRCHKTCKSCSGERKDQCQTCYDTLSITSTNSCEPCKNRGNGAFLDFQSQKCGYDEDLVCDENINTQSTCQNGCQSCTNAQSCLKCQCLKNCPSYTKIEGRSCLNTIDQMDAKKYNISQIAKELHDNNRIKELFTLSHKQGSYNFQKGEEIYFSYFSNKRIFGGPFVWVNAQFKFEISWIQNIYRINIFFEVILGDTHKNRNNFTYIINNQPVEISLHDKFQQSDEKIEDLNWPDNYIYNIYGIEYNFFQQVISDKQLIIEFNCKNIEILAFCGIQNLMVAGQYCQSGYKFEYFYFETDRNPCIVDNEECDDDNVIPFDGCFSNIYDCIQGCQNCIFGICQDCQIGWDYQESTKTCRPLCGDAKITYNEECDDGNLIPYDGCHQCKYSCPLNCEKCKFGKCSMCENQHIYIDGQCLHIYLLNNINFEENIEQYNFQINEKNQHRLQFENQLQQFILRNNYDQFNHNLNQIIFWVFGYQNQYYFQDQINYCKVNYFGKCLECQAEYELDFYKSKCIPKCNDQIILSEEICDDGNRIQFDGCYKCQNSCQIECLLCFQSQCYLCQDGWHLQEYQCKQICGDGQLAILSNEQCDDPEDSNCANCKYQCEDDCLVCNKFQSCEICQYPFQKKNGKCIPICGDSIITSIFEQCDDDHLMDVINVNINVLQDVFNVKKIIDVYYVIIKITFWIIKLFNQIIDPLPEEEINNDDLIIRQCDGNQILIENECVTQCGNGILNQNFEQCDDGNQNGGDGCSTLCFQEDSYQCNNQDKQLSVCTFIQAPIFELILISQKQDQTKILELSFSQEVYIPPDFLFEQIVKFTIIPETQYELSLIPISNITSQLSNPKYQVFIKFLKSIVNPILQVNIQKYSIFNQYEMELNNNDQEIPLGTPFVLSETNQKKVSQFIQMNELMIYSTATFSGLLFLTGNYVVFFNLLDLLQTLSYLKYMQYKFPSHLSLFLETYTKISLEPILNILKVDEFIADLNGGTIPNLNKKSFQSKQTDPLNQIYLMNAKGCYFSYFASLLTYYLCCLIASNKLSMWLKKCFKKFQFNIKILKLISMFQRKIQFQCSIVKKHYFSLGVFQLFYSSLHQLLFSALLQFPDYTFNSLFEIINSVAAFVSLLIQIQIFLKLLSITTTQIKDKIKWKYFFQDQKTQYWAANFKSFQIFRIISYITIIVKLIKFPEAQSILLSMQSLFYLIYLIIFRPIQSNYDLAKLICREIILFIITGSFLVYSFEINYDQFLIFGWIHISLFCFLMGFTIVADLVQQINLAYLHRQKLLQIQKIKKIMCYYNNPLQKFVVYDLKNSD
ncbi:unnamed protein product [Paramecium sonneborni]|uniref:Uncharacterized protein n=1 Tax=Paramecium sonneborni TaxID=65129 RepID=A0A8S1P3P8_9CILI|nr:unnamed protein product [Paramecium sonneborni]